MKLYEFEGKSLLNSAGISVPEGHILDNHHKPLLPSTTSHFVVKAQILTGKRMLNNGVLFADNKQKALEYAQTMLHKSFNNFHCAEVLIEEKIPFQTEFYLAFLIDTDTRRPKILFSSSGGINIETSDSKMSSRSIEHDFHPWMARELAVEQGVKGKAINTIASVLVKSWNTFVKNDLIFLEINPLVLTPEGKPVALDCMAEIDSDSLYRHKNKFPPRSEMGRPATKRELLAHKIDENDHRGIAGKYLELDGDIAMMTAGGGASLTNMDALLAFGGKPANFTEYGGNPPAEKVLKLTKIILGKPGIKGCWHVGGTANNTRIDETMKGFADALRELKPNFPIVVRRDGPNREAGFDHLRKVRDDLNLTMRIFDNTTPMTLTARILIDVISGKNPPEKGV